MGEAALAAQLVGVGGEAAAAGKLEVGREPEILKKLAFVDVPVAVEPRAAQLVGQGLEAAEVVGVGGHERGVVGHERADEAVILGALGAEVLPVDEQALDPAVADAAGVHRAVDAFRIIIHSAYAGAQGVHLRLGVLGGLVDEEHVDLGALKSGGVLVAVAVAEEDAAAVGEDDVLFGVVVGGDALGGVVVETAEHGAEGEDVVFLKLGVGAADNHDLDAGVVKAEERGLDAHGPAFAAAARPAVADEFVLVGEEKQLFFVRFWYQKFRHVCSSRVVLYVVCVGGGAPLRQRSGGAAPPPWLSLTRELSRKRLRERKSRALRRMKIDEEFKILAAERRPS